MSFVQISKAPSDPICARVSLGGLKDRGYYCTYRGSRDDAIEILKQSLAALIEHRDNGPEPKVDRRYKELGAS